MDFKLPELGEGVYEAEVVRWLVKPGDAVRSGQTLVEMLTDKATMEVPAPFAGVIDDMVVESGQKVSVGDVILHYTDKKGANAKADAKPERKAEPKAERAEESKSETKAKREEKSEADGDPETKVEGDEESAAETKAEAKAKKPTESPPTKPQPAKERPSAPARDNGAATAVKAAPSVRLMARKLGIDLQSVHGSGPAGRILIDDLSQHVSTAKAPTAAPVVPPGDYGKPGTRIKFVGVRRKIAEHMVLSKRTIPHYSYVDECDVTDLVKLREGLKESFAKKGTKLTYLAFFVKATVAALQEVPIVNATLNEEAGEIVLHDQYHVGIAVATPGGLIVPVVRDADKKSLLEISTEIERLSHDARQGKSKLDDLRGGTFSVTSVGNIGGLFSTPIINHPQLGILGVGKIVKRPIYDEHGQIKPADMLYLSFSFDHRVVDGAVGAAFGNAVIKHLQQPAALII